MDTNKNCDILKEENHCNSIKTSCQHNREFIQKVSPSLSYKGSNYKLWKKQAREKLSELIGMDKFTAVDTDLLIEYEKQIDNAVEIRFTYQSELGYRVPGHLFIPNGVEKPPVMICLQGHTSGMHISFGRAKYSSDENSIKSGDRDFCVRAVKEGFAAVAIEQRNFGECGVRDKWCFESAMTALLFGRTTVGERVWDIMRLIDVLQTEFADKIDINTICCMGNSGGGTATAYAAALEDRITLAMPCCAMCTYKDSIGAMHHCACNYVPNIANYFDMNDLITMAYPKLYIQVSGTEDNIFPFFAAEEVFKKGSRIYEENGKLSNCVLVKGNGGHRFYADDAWPLVHKLLK